MYHGDPRRRTARFCNVFVDCKTLGGGIGGDCAAGEMLEEAPEGARWGEMRRALLVEAENG
jgi:hypothetical protein